MTGISLSNSFPFTLSRNCINFFYETDNAFTPHTIFLYQHERTTDKDDLYHRRRLQVPFIKYVIGLTHKPNPKDLHIPTASADNPYNIAHWYELCADLPAKPFVLRTFLNSSPEQETFEETILSMDAIVVGGGSTLNMIAIWKAQGHRYRPA
jgi:hypothetical protein